MRCVRCEQVKPKEEFYSRDRTCKECRKGLVRANRLKKIDYYRAYDRDRSNDPDRVKARETYRNNPKKKDIIRSSQARWLAKNKIKRLAHVWVSNAVRDGRLVKKPCEFCGNEKTQAHHDDYRKPTQVRWLCHKHHGQVHRELNEGKR